MSYLDERGGEFAIEQAVAGGLEVSREHLLMHAPAALRLQRSKEKKRGKKKYMSSWRAGGEASAHYFLCMHTPAALRLREEGQGRAAEVTGFVSGLFSG